MGLHLIIKLHFFLKNKKPTGKDEITYFANIRQIPNEYKKVINGKKEDAIKIVVLVSSTAAGTGPKDSKNAWVNRYRRKVIRSNGYNEVINLAVGGYTTYQLLPSNAKLKANRPKPDIRAKLPETRGLWPAIWLLGQNIYEKGWPYCGELDIMEEVGHIPFRVRGTTIFNDATKNTQYIGEKYELRYSNFSDDFHVFSIVWDERGIRYLVDNKKYYDKTYKELNIDKDNNPFFKPFFMILNCAVGGNLPRNPDYTSRFPQTFKIDYVRYFKENRVQYYAKVVKKVTKMPKKDKVWVYLMAGQSNMEGNGQIMPQDTIPNPRLITINTKGEWVILKEPINLNFPWYRKLDCGHSFGNELLKKAPKDVTVAMISTAVGGSSVNQWLDDSEFRTMHLWSNITKMIGKAKKVGIIKGMIWHQGETDAKPEMFVTYATKLNTLIYKNQKRMW